MLNEVDVVGPDFKVKLLSVTQGKRKISKNGLGLLSYVAVFTKIVPL